MARRDFCRGMCKTLGVFVYGSLGLLLLLSPVNSAPAQDGLLYDAVIKGIDEKSFRMDLESALTTFDMKNRPPPTVNLLRYRAEEDIPVIMKALRSRGYYAAKVEIEIDEASRPLLITFQVAPGPLFVFSGVDITICGMEKEHGITLPSANMLGLKKGDPAKARTVLDAQEKLLSRIASQGRPFPRVLDRRVVVDHSSREVSVTFEINPGPSARFGNTAVTGLQSVAEDFVLKKITWLRGQEFNGDLLPRFQQKLIKTGLFSIVRVSHADHPDEDGMLPVSVELTERKQRTVKAGLKYGADEGIGGKIAWEHRNLLHHGERFSFGVEASQIILALESRFNKPFFFSDRQSLDVNFKLGQDDTDVYTSESIDAGAIVDRQLKEKLIFGAGLGFRQAQVDQMDQREDYSLFYLPAHLDWNSTDDLLNPSRGVKFSVRVAPYYDLVKSNRGFLKGFLNFNHYWEVLDHPYVLFAARTAMGSIIGDETKAIPADLRFYAGGGGSVRGYPYQMIGPIINGKSIGGRSILELSGEFRFKVTETFGFVAFVDGGNAYESNYPDLSHPIRWGAGAGLRYYTAFGPLRLDVGMPVNPPSNVSDPFQIYISIGQAF
ncbi:MAG: autotransporter assembly complex family protein [Syntrophobacteraceae bacterium]